MPDEFKHYFSHVILVTAGDAIANSFYPSSNGDEDSKRVLQRSTKANAIAKQA
ncbi:hypothetical protein LC608_08230 [Nostoc sp. XA010]|uniref:hypothetical protein n=1 Tax=Nostoc sp. XA010 TaxID=2780407 RepID=UPI001E2BC1F4|nr:hypothetical protein [Nostoc sp. XA010]MCC5656975.1 hypothetical protein [Nostoc sp. XA010]